MKWAYKKKLVRTWNKVSSFDANAYRIYRSKESILLKYWDHEKNWGDSVNPYLVNKLTGLPVISSNRILNYLHKPELLGLGSIVIGNISNYVIWGSGIFSQTTKLYNKPRAVLALRGKHTLARIREVGADCNLFGDPALLFPNVYPYRGSKKFRYGVIPHYKDKNAEPVKKLKELFPDELLVIDIQSDIETFADQVLQCENILSSSLHGLILAEAYGIPTCKVAFSSNVLSGDFKFIDYYSGVGIDTLETVDLQHDIRDIKKAFLKCTVKDISFDSAGLLAALKEYVSG